MEEKPEYLAVRPADKKLKLLKETQPEVLPKVQPGIQPEENPDDGEDNE